jgi:uncharacterized protein YebE (UPF0316 family)
MLAPIAMFDLPTGRGTATEPEERTTRVNLPIAISLPTSPALPLLVFGAELCVVTISTVRIIFVSRGMKVLAPILGFFEITIWLFAIGQIMQNLSDLGCYLGFAGGFTLGNYLGVLIEKRLALGNLMVRTVSRRGSTDLIRKLRGAGCRVTSVEAAGASGPVTVVFTVIPRKELDGVIAIVRTCDPETFFTVEEVQQARPGVFPTRKSQRIGMLPSLLTFRRMTRESVESVVWEADKVGDKEVAGVSYHESA